MVNVIASIRVKEGQRADFIEIFKSNIPAVLEEEGCIRYAPAVDLHTGIPSQKLDGNIVTVIEKWNTLDDLKAHLEAPHMLAFRERVQGMVEDVSLKVLENAQALSVAYSLQACASSGSNPKLLAHAKGSELPGLAYHHKSVSPILAFPS